MYQRKMSAQKKTYVAPAKRKEIIQEKGLSKDDLDSQKLFPTLCEAGKNPWKGKSFKATVDDMIASEKDKDALEASKAEMDEWVHLPAIRTREDYIRYRQQKEAQKNVSVEAKPIVPQRYDEYIDHEDEEDEEDNNEEEQ